MRFSPSRVGCPGGTIREAGKAGYRESPRRMASELPRIARTEAKRHPKGRHIIPELKEKGGAGGFALFRFQNCDEDQSRSRSLMDVFDRVFSSTRLTMTAQ
ncbi:hypothetical protein FHS76_003017 [Ochrobactrum daejeonense]|uniref:Uncharacterized protein n=1 Tax=Brucella daejeonensis TaxID=659015 RepID=A0A7W9AYW7_9HYPH|nr:hypothetical protein [Brucella daejeonensis]